jgi:hypothetical protein
MHVFLLVLRLLLPPFFRVRNRSRQSFFHPAPRRLYLRPRATRDHGLAAVIDARESNIGSAYHRREGVVCCAGNGITQPHLEVSTDLPGLGGIVKEGFAVTQRHALVQHSGGWLYDAYPRCTEPPSLKDGGSYSGNLRAYRSYPKTYHQDVGVRREMPPVKTNTNAKKVTVSLLYWQPKPTTHRVRSVGFVLPVGKSTYPIFCCCWASARDPLLQVPALVHHNGVPSRLAGRASAAAISAVRPRAVRRPRLCRGRPPAAARADERGIQSFAPSRPDSETVWPAWFRPRGAHLPLRCPRRPRRGRPRRRPGRRRRTNAPSPRGGQPPSAALAPTPSKWVGACRPSCAAPRAAQRASSAEVAALLRGARSAATPSPATAVAIDAGRRFRTAPHRRLELISPPPPSARPRRRRPTRPPQRRPLPPAFPHLAGVPPPHPLAPGAARPGTTAVRCRDD